MRPNLRRRTSPSRLPRLWHPLLVSMLLVPLGACTLGPDYQPPGAPVPPAYKEVAGWKIAQPRAHVDKGAWWSIYNDPVLDALERQVEVSNQNLAAAEAAYRQAAALVQEARAAVPDHRPSLQPDAPACRPQCERNGTRHHTEHGDARDDRLGHRRLGPHPAHDREQRRPGTGQRGRRRERQALGASPTRNRLFQYARRRTRSAHTGATVDEFKRTQKITENEYNRARRRGPT